jgi:hypothetical protein
MSSTSTTQRLFTPSVQQWKPNAPQQKEGASKPKRKDFSDVNSNPETGISLCIPFAFKTVGPKRVFAIFRRPTIITATGETICDVSLGFIERIDIKYRQDGNKCVFIHFAPGRWNDTDTTREILAAMKAGTPLKVVTDENGHFWKTIISKSQRPADYFEDEVEPEAGGDSTDGQVVEMDDEFA